MPAERVRHMFTKAAGVSHENDDGTRRQAIIPKCQPYGRPVLEHDDANQHDPNAVKVLRQTGEHIGWLKRAATRPELRTADRTGGEVAGSLGPERRLTPQPLPAYRRRVPPAGWKRVFPEEFTGT